MGRGLADVSKAGRLAYDFVDCRPGMVRVRTAAGVKSPVEVSAEILATLRQRAEDTFEADLFGAVITVPAYFDDAQRQATKDAAELAGLDVLRLISEPTAASIAYGLDNGSEGLYAVYDLGGGTFDISLLRMTRGVFEVVATGGDSALGGDDIDAALADWALARAGVDCRRAQAIGAPRRWRRAPPRRRCRARDRAVFSLHRRRRAASSCRSRAPTSRRSPSRFVDRTMAAVRQAVRDAKVDKSAIDGIVLVGGSTRMPLVPPRRSASSSAARR